ncbi:hypothetical protein MKW94_021197 [Papaver nudicaule]|uniref:BURP domain-containing protein n=1 Tax=Papaver nudicaule TaxID=74823 RepID=A0AA41VQ26_PAPNU|nr:hypothetical protein [Papaver nudicaule]
MQKLFLFSFLLFSAFLSVNGESPFTAKASLIRYWNIKISNNLPKPTFLISKASPLNAVDSSFYTKLADQNSLSTHLASFCSSANLVCMSDLTPSLAKHSEDVSFSKYSERNFTNYGTDRLGGVDSFKNYSDDANLAADSFRRYSRDAIGHLDKFANYQPDGNVADASFNTYATKATGGSGDFTNYNPNKNVPNLKFTSYADNGLGRVQTFTHYTDNVNAGDQKFTSYGKNGNSIKNGFSSYGKNSNVMGSTFQNYGESGNAANDSFTSYAFDTNVPQNTFKNYGADGNAATEEFTSYREQANVGDDSFTSYAKDSNAANVKFTTYGKSFNEGSDKFSGYGQKASNQNIGFKIYGINNSFTDYKDKRSISFAQYTKRTSAGIVTSSLMEGHDHGHSGGAVNRWVEPGKFFRESNLKSGNVMPMPDIRDKMPKRSFLPRSISSKLPFSSLRMSELKSIFHADENSTMEGILKNTVGECERVPSEGETKKCVGSIEDMIDFATSVLGQNVVVRSTESVKGSKSDVMIGQVKGINGGQVTKSVSCHQSLFPYLVYYCHSVPKVRVYEAEILDAKTKEKINKGTAICHVDTSAWSPTHGAFLALGSKPGKIEVCHWIFENDMTWARAD